MSTVCPAVFAGALLCFHHSLPTLPSPLMEKNILVVKHSLLRVSPIFSHKKLQKDPPAPPFLSLSPPPMVPSQLSSAEARRGMRLSWRPGCTDPAFPMRPGRCEVGKNGPQKHRKHPFWGSPEVPFNTKPGHRNIETRLGRAGLKICYRDKESTYGRGTPAIFLPQVWFGNASQYIWSNGF